MQRSNTALIKYLLFTCRSVLEDRQCYSKKLLTWSLWPCSKSAEHTANECSSQGIPAPLARCTPSAASLFVGCGLVGWSFLLLTKQPKQSRYTCSHFLKAYQRQSIPFSRNCPVSSEAPAACCGCSAFSVSPLPTDAFCQFNFSNGFVGKSKCSLTLISVFTVPTRARNVLHNHQHAVKNLSKSISA